MCFAFCLGVRVPATSPFQTEKLASFDFGLKGIPKILKIFLWVASKILKNVEVLPGAAKEFYPRCDAAELMAP